jgi:hypothetical protein
MGSTNNRRNLSKLLNEATKQELCDGLRYYDDQRSRLLAIGRLTQLDLDTLAGMFAALSPSNTEKRTYRDLLALLRRRLPRDPFNGSPLGFTAWPTNRDKASRIMSGECPHIVLRGPKVCAFFDNLRSPYSRKVTVDGHMFNAWRGKVAPLTSNGLNVDKYYDRVAADVHKLTPMWLRPCQLQAVLWIVWKRVNRIAYSAQRDLFVEEDWI